MRYQHTIKSAMSTTGVGLHSGQPSTLTLSPAPPDKGVVFRQTVEGVFHSCPASIHHVIPTELCTAVGANGVQVHTVEHILAALSGLEVDNVYVDVDAQEVPVLDGSAAPFVELIQGAESTPQDKPREFLKVLQPIHIANGSSQMTVLPSEAPCISCTIQFDHSLIQTQKYEYIWDVSDFQQEIAPARTFAFNDEIEAIWKKGLGQGGSLMNTLVFSDTAVLNEQGLRFADECVRHKVLDIIGDLTLLGRPMIGHVMAHCSGHALHNQFVKEILACPESWRIVYQDEMNLIEPSHVLTTHSIHTAPFSSAIAPSS
ncbi:MAG: UDP-3-O-[3-hydroxymyristoyl] N-acetylglucosamine deacetylase [Nitrospirales bacterium]|nr:UDP-3-O-[3-hydroxymyristoyl] N-acetylglucosamine deacetylase [Nitrospirales bacterium]